MKYSIKQDRVNRTVEGYLDRYTGGNLANETPAFRSGHGQMEPVGFVPSDDGEYGEAWRKYMRHGSRGMSQPELEVLRGGFDMDSRAQTAGGTAAGGYAVAGSAMARLEKAMPTSRRPSTPDIPRPGRRGARGTESPRPGAPGVSRHAARAWCRTADTRALRRESGAFGRRLPDSR